jgi:hypothetical protein
MLVHGLARLLLLDNLRGDRPGAQQGLWMARHKHGVPAESGRRRICAAMINLSSHFSNAAQKSLETKKSAPKRKKTPLESGKKTARKRKKRTRS